MPPNYDDDSPVYTGHPVRRDHPDDYYSSGAGVGPAAGFGDPGRPFPSDEETFVREEMTVLPPPSALPYYESRADALAYPDRAESPSHTPWRPPGDRSRSRSYSSSSNGSRTGQQQRRRRRSDASSSPVSRARHVVEDNFTNSGAGIGASILGAVVGGFVASRASDAAFAPDRSPGGRNRRQRRRRHGAQDCGDGDDDYDGEGDGDDDEKEDEQRRAMARGVSALIGAVAGGLGANAFAHHVEGEREKRQSRESAYRSRNIDGEHKRHSQRHNDDYHHGYDNRQRDDSHHRKS